MPIFITRNTVVNIQVEADITHRHHKKYCSVIIRVRTDTEKVWKVLEFNVEIFKALKSLENDHRYGKVFRKCFKTVMLTWKKQMSITLITYACVNFLALYDNASEV